METPQKTSDFFIKYAPKASDFFMIWHLKASDFFFNSSWSSCIYSDKSAIFA